VGRVVAAGRNLALVGVAFSLVAALVGFGWGGYRTVRLVVQLVSGRLDGMAVGLMQVMDAFLIAAGLLIFALALYELFIGETGLPHWLVIRDLDALKSRVAGIVVMVMAVAFLERMEAHDEARDVLYNGAAVALVSLGLILSVRRK
jgi:uncharacterized membrane protein YqhA